MRQARLLAVLLAVAGCDGNSDEAGPQVTNEVRGGTASGSPPPRGELIIEHFEARLGSKDCADIVRLYLAALGGRDYTDAARVWNDPTIDAARLEQVFGSYKELRFAWTEPVIEGAAGSLYCTVSGKLTDAQDPARPPIEDTLTLKRVNDVPGATPDQLRWTLRESTFVERLERSDGRKP